MRIERGAAPSAGFSEAERIVSQAPEINKNSAAVLANAPREDHNLFELCHELRNWLSVDDILSLMSARLKRLVPHKSLAIYLLRNGILTPELVSGENFSLFSSLRIPLGEGLCGWVAQNCKPIVNGNPTVEFGYVHDLSKYSALQSALAVPLEGDCGVTAVLSLYRGPEDAFTNIDLCKVEAVVLRMGPVVERAARSMASGATAGH
jgi:putative methionine-R-sulfoxide reductase with GAF domain